MLGFFFWVTTRVVWWVNNVVSREYAAFVFNHDAVPSKRLPVSTRL